MKKGFTLAEVLITLGIIGIIVALTLPAVNSTRPDGNKIKYLKTYDSLCELVKSFASNTREYPIVGANDANTAYYDMSDVPLLNVHTSAAGSISSSDGRDFNDTAKLCHLLAWGYNNANDNCNVTNTVLAQNPSNASGGYFIRSFIANNGVDFSVRPRVNTVVGAQSTFGMNVIIDINGIGNVPNCVYSANCRRPDRFWFFITADGNVIPADRVGRYYIQTRKAVRLVPTPPENELPSAISWADVPNSSIGALEQVQQE
ncbi:prepilin-type N-terminal cleavage/methylation domain-containing protein [bacterium]|nr:prepilin-type N-terminal cleavage/methylation domain-containing protein [bacterium]